MAINADVVSLSIEDRFKPCYMNYYLDRAAYIGYISVQTGLSFSVHLLAFSYQLHNEFMLVLYRHVQSPSAMSITKMTIRLILFIHSVIVIFTILFEIPWVAYVLATLLVILIDVLQTPIGII